VNYRERFPNATTGHRQYMPEWKLQEARRMRCAPTPAEAKLWEALRKKQLGGLRFRRQAPLYGYIADFWCNAHRLVIEVDGPYHAERQAEDARRDEVMASYDITVLRVTNDEVLADLDGVLTRICESIPVEAA
jgi:very-short-patch-repair endonuclease